MFRQSRAGRLGCDPEIRRRREGIEGRRGAHHQQPHGVDGGDFRAGGAEETMHRRSLHRQPVCAAGHHRLDPWLEEERLAHRRQEAGQERRPLAAAGCGAKDARRALALGQGPRRPRRKRARRSTGAGGRGHGAVEAGAGLKGDTRSHTPPSSPGLTARSSIPETFAINREAAAYWVARSSRAMTVVSGPTTVVIAAIAPRKSYSCASSASPPETSTLPGAGSRLSFFTTPSSTSIE